MQRDSAVRARARRTSQHLHSGLTLTSLLLPKNEQPTIPQGPHEPRFCFLPTPFPYKSCLRRDRAGNVCPTLPRLFGTPTICTFRPLSSRHIVSNVQPTQHSTCASIQQASTDGGTRREVNHQTPQDNTTLPAINPSTPPAYIFLNVVLELTAI